MKKFFTLGLIGITFFSAIAETEFASIGNYSSIEEAMPAIFSALPNNSGYQSLDLSKGELLPTVRKYNDFGLVEKRVSFKFSFTGNEIKMFYSEHQMNDKTRGEWEDCPTKLTKKDKAFFNAFVEALEKYKNDAEYKKVIDAEFYANGKLLLQLMQDYPETTFKLWNENSIGLKCDFAYIMFLDANQNTDEQYEKYGYKVNLELLQVVKDKVPLKIVMYANSKSKTNPDGMHKDISKLNKKENYWFSSLNAEIISFTKEPDGTYLMLLKDFS